MTTFSLVLILLGAVQSGKEPVPDPAAQKDVEKILREVFKDDYAKKTPADRLALAKKLLKQGSDAKDEPATRYFTLREAMEVAVSAGDPATASQAIDELGKSFDVDPVRLKFTALSTIVKDPRPAETLKAAAALFLALVDEALAREDLETAEKSAAAGAANARKSKDVGTAARAEARGKELADQKQKLLKIKTAREALKANPEDPAANAEVGQNLCFALGNWEAGLPLLAKGSQEALKALASKDLANPEQAPDQVALADEWRELAEKETGAVRQRIRERAAFWYSKAYAASAGLVKVKIEKRLAEIGSTVYKIAPVVRDVISSEGLLGWWRLDEGTGEVIEDSSEHKRHGKLMGGTWAEGHAGKGIQMAGKGEMLSVPDAPELRLAGDLTISIWVKKESQNQDWIRLVGKGSSNFRNYGVWLGGPNQTNGGSYQVMLQQFSAGPRESLCIFSGAKVTVGAWTHIAAVIQGNEGRVYVNGRREGAGKRAEAPETSSDPLTFGYGGLHQSMTGLIDDIRLYSRALTDQEIQKLAAAK